MAQPHTRAPNARRPTIAPMMAAAAKVMGLSHNGYRTSGDMPAQHGAGDDYCCRTVDAPGQTTG